MVEDKRPPSTPKHTMVLDKRENLSLTGILDVISFNEEEILVDTDLGLLRLSGSLLHVSKLNLQNGELQVDGEISQISYEDQGYSKNKKALFSKLFR